MRGGGKGNVSTVNLEKDGDLFVILRHARSGEVNKTQ